VNGFQLDHERLFAGQPRRRVRLPTYPFDRQRHWVEPDAEAVAPATDSELRKRKDLAEWFCAPSWSRAGPPISASAPRQATTWLVLADDSGLARLLVDRLRGRPGDRVVTVRRGRGFGSIGAMDYTVSPASAADYELLARELRRLGIAPGRIVHLWSLPGRPTRTSRRMLLEYSENIVSDYYSLVFLVRALGGEIEEGRVDVLSSGSHPAPGDRDLNPEKAVVGGVRRVLAREYPQLVFGSVDVKLGVTRAEHGPLIDRLIHELDADAVEGDVALRGNDRWIRRFDSVSLPESSAAAWVRPGGVYLVTGGLGGLGMAVAEHLARTAPRARAWRSRSPRTSARAPSGSLEPT
jgi:acyl transferase domain-containing protein